MSEKNLEKIFKDALDHYEADVNPGLWHSVQSGLAGKGAAVSGVSGASQTGSFLANLGMKGLLWTASAVVVSGLSLYAVLSGDPDPVVTRDSNPVSNVEAPLQQGATEDHMGTVASVPTREDKMPSLSASETKVNTVRNLSEKAVEPSGVTKAITPTENTHAQAEPAPVHSPQVINTSLGKTNETIQATETENSIETIEPVMAQIEDYLFVENTSARAKLPNTFSPNGDGTNDMFSIHTKGLKSLKVNIFNTMGQLIFKWEGLEGAWNGSLANGNEAPEGNYIYSVEAVTSDGKICIGQSLLVLARKKI